MSAVLAEPKAQETWPAAVPQPLACAAPAHEATPTSWWPGIRSVFARDLRVALRRRADSLAALAFFVMVASLFPLGVGPEAALLRSMGPGVLWVAALLACLLTLPRLFADDYQDGTLEQLLLAAQPLPLLVLAKVAAHWVVAGLPLVLVAPLLGLQFGLSVGTAGVLMLSLLLGTPVLSLVGAVGSALTVGLRGAGLLLPLLTLPLYAPVLIFGAGMAEAHTAGLPVCGHVSLLAALLVLALAGVPYAAAAALRISLD